MEECFHIIDECHEKHQEKKQCLADSQNCFSYNYGFDYCFKDLANCVGRDEESDAEDHDQQYCGCSCQMSRCFDDRDNSACTIMFDLCFESKHQGDDDQQHVDGSGGYDVPCLVQVQECVHENTDHDQCIDIMAKCFVHSEAKDCSVEVTECIAENKYNIAQCYDVITECSHNQEEEVVTRDCYSTLEQCYSSGSTNHGVCDALLPTCYTSVEEGRLTSCYTEARACLLEDVTTNIGCHDQLKLCLEEEEHAGEEQDYAEDDCADYVQECLSSSELSPSVCYRYLRRYVSGGQCHLEPPQDDHYQGPQPIFPPSDEQFYHQHQQFYNPKNYMNFQPRPTQQTQPSPQVYHGHDHRRAAVQDNWEQSSEKLNEGKSFYG